MFQCIASKSIGQRTFHVLRNTNPREFVQFKLREFRNGVLIRERQFDKAIDAKAAVMFSVHFPEV